MQPLIAMQEELREKVGKPKRSVAVPAVDATLKATVEELALPRIRQAMEFVAKQERHAAVAEAAG